jgi:hypothetical protein
VDKEEYLEDRQPVHKAYLEVKIKAGFSEIKIKVAVYLELITKLNL